MERADDKELFGGHWIVKERASSSRRGWSVEDSLKAATDWASRPDQPLILSGTCVLSEGKKEEAGEEKDVGILRTRKSSSSYLRFISLKRICESGIIAVRRRDSKMR